MTINGWLQILLFFALVLALTKPMGVWLTRVFNGELTFLHPLERALYCLCGIDEKRAMRWTEYAAAMLAFSAVSMLLLYLLQRTQAWLPFNPQAFANLSPHLAFNTAASFTTNTNWQSYGGETTMSYLTQMVGLTFHNFVSAAVGMALAVAFIRGIAQREQEALGNFWPTLGNFWPTLGNFWIDVTRATLYVLLPLSFVVALFLVSQGVVQNLNAYTTAQVIDAAGEVKTQTIAQGPAASQVAIKMLGTNGGGFFNANAAHPFENPTPLANFVQMLLIFLIPAGLTYTLGRMTGAQRHGWAVLAAMLVLSVAGVVVTYWAEAQGNPLLPASVAQSGNWEGKETRFGIANSALFAVVTTDASCGAVNAMHDSFTPLGGLVTLVNIMLGEVVFGGVGAGLYGMLIFVILAVFLAGLMVGRTPEYLGKKIEAYDVKMAMLYALIFPLLILTLTAVSVLSPMGLNSLNNNGPHGLTEILYAFTSGAGNNGSAFAGLNANTTWYNTALGLAMLAGRFLMIVPMLAVAGHLARKKIAPPSAGTFPVTTPLFTVLLISVIVIVGALTFFPVLSLGPIVEHLLMQAGKTF